MEKSVYRKCIKCGAIVKVIKDCTCGDDCGIKCCGEKMQEIPEESINEA